MIRHIDSLKLREEANECICHKLMRIRANRDRTPEERTFYKENVLDVFDVVYDCGNCPQCAGTIIKCKICGAIFEIAL